VMLWREAGQGVGDRVEGIRSGDVGGQHASGGAIAPIREDVVAAAVIRDGERPLASRVTAAPVARTRAATSGSSAPSPAMISGMPRESASCTH
jgi:hypothetical protein